LQGLFALRAQCKQGCLRSGQEIFDLDFGFWTEEKPLDVARAKSHHERPNFTPKLIRFLLLFLVESTCKKGPKMV
jgi:hypothetical protein